VGEGRVVVGCTIAITCSEFHKRRVQTGDSVKLRSSMDMLTCAGECALLAGKRAACSGALVH
jgi:hypothetical protein